MFTNEEDESGLFSKIGQTTHNNFSFLKKKDNLLKGIQTSIDMPIFNKVRVITKSMLLKAKPKNSKSIINLKKKLIEPTCTKYTPVFNFLFKNEDFVKNWKLTEKKTISKKQKENKNFNFLAKAEIEDFICNSKNVVIMSPEKKLEIQSQFPSNFHVRQQYEKNQKIRNNQSNNAASLTNSPKKKNISEFGFYKLRSQHFIDHSETLKNKKSSTSVNNNNSGKKNIYNKKATLANNDSPVKLDFASSFINIHNHITPTFPNGEAGHNKTKSYFNSISNDSDKLIVKTKKESALQFSKSKSKLNKSVISIKKIECKLKKDKIKALNFDNVLSREYYSKQNKSKNEYEPMSLPFFSNRFNKKKILIDFSKSTVRETNTNVLNDITPDYFNPNDHLEKINNFSKTQNIKFSQPIHSPITYIFNTESNSTELNTKLKTFYSGLTKNPSNQIDMSSLNQSNSKNTSFNNSLGKFKYKTKFNESEFNKEKQMARTTYYNPNLYSKEKNLPIFNLKKLTEIQKYAKVLPSYLLNPSNNNCLNYKYLISNNYPNSKFIGTKDSDWLYNKKSHNLFIQSNQQNYSLYNKLYHFQEKDEPKEGKENPNMQSITEASNSAISNTYAYYNSKQNMSNIINYTKKNKLFYDHSLDKIFNNQLKRFDGVSLSLNKPFNITANEQKKYDKYIESKTKIEN